MSGSPSWLLQQAIYTRLSGDTELVTTLGCDVYDVVPQGATFPYVAIGDVTEDPNDTMGRTGRDLAVPFHIYSQYAGKKEVKLIHERIDELLDRWAPTITGWNATQMQHEFFETSTEQDGITHRGESRYGVHAHQ